MDLPAVCITLMQDYLNTWLVQAIISGFTLRFKYILVNKWISILDQTKDILDQSEHRATALYLRYHSLNIQNPSM